MTVRASFANSDDLLDSADPNLTPKRIANFLDDRQPEPEAVRLVRVLLSSD